ncbi:MAG: hypothetical protein E7429_02415 [Ruminococcaceae bacterium]|nr:hypothetical protein [Oscillospiraceae bacterium]
MQTYLIAALGELPFARQHCPSLACAAYHIGAGSSLLRQNALLTVPPGGVLCVSDQNAPFIDDPDTLCAAAVRECSRRAYDGVLLNFTQPPTQDRLTFAARLARILRSEQRRLYLPESYGVSIPDAAILLDTALSGGSLTEHLQEAAARWGTHRLALDVSRVRMQFPLPCPSGVGTSLSEEVFQALMAQEAPAVFFSPELCARYFTYVSSGATRFVLFDDADTLKEKLRLGQQFGISAAFFRWAEIADLADALFPQT